MRAETWMSWAIGLAFGAMSGFMVIVGGAPFLLLSIAAVALAFVVARSLALLSGAFMGIGGTWLALLTRAQLACDAFDAGPNQGCQGSGVEPFLAVSGIVLAIGVLLGALAWRRRRAQLTAARSGSSPLSR